MKRLLFILISFAIILNSCMSDSQSEASSEEIETHEINVERLEANYDLPEAEMLLNDFEHNHSFNDSILMAKEILINEGYDLDAIPYILVDSNMVREVFIKYNEMDTDEEEPDVILAVQIAEPTKIKEVPKEIIDENATLIHDHDLPPNAVIFPHHETMYDWQSSDTTLDNSIWVGITISEQTNKLGNYTYTVYMSSNTVSDNLIHHVIVGEINIMYFSEDKYVDSRSNEKRKLQSKEDFKQQLTKEVNESEDKGHLFNSLEDFKASTLIITHEQIPVHTFFLPDNKSEIIVMWKYIKKID